jgi:hypothetical protein
MRRHVVAALFAVLGFAPIAAGQVQLGLRLDARTSMQWSGETLYLQAERRSTVRTHAGEILEVWPGPVAGSFGVSTAQGVGILLGCDAVVGARVGAPGDLVRSSRYDALWLLRRSGRGSEIVEFHSPSAGRVLLRTDTPLQDFDVDVRGRLVALGADGVLTYTIGEGRSARIPAPVPVSRGSRVFVDAKSSEIVLYSPGRLARFSVADGEWQVSELSEATHALVRDAYTRRMLVELRLR